MYKLLFLQENYSNKVIKPSGSIFGIDLDMYELVEDENAIPESNGLKVIFSNAMLTHCKKLLSKDKEAMAELNKIRGMKPSQIKALQKNQGSNSPEPSKSDLVKSTNGSTHNTLEVSELNENNHIKQPGMHNM